MKKVAVQYEALGSPAVGSAAACVVQSGTDGEWAVGSVTRIGTGQLSHLLPKDLLVDKSRYSHIVVRGIIFPEDSSACRSVSVLC